MLRFCYLNKPSGCVVMLEKEVNLKDFVYLGAVGNGKDGHPVGMQPANICLTCGAPREKTENGMYSCPKGHSYTTSAGLWGPPDQQDLFVVEKVGPVPFPYVSPAPNGSVLRPASIEFTAALHRVEDQWLGSDLWVPADSFVCFKRPTDRYNSIKDCLKVPGKAELSKKQVNGLRQVGFTLSKRAGDTNLVVGDVLGVFQVILEHHVRLDWRGQP